MTACTIFIDKPMTGLCCLLLFLSFNTPAAALFRCELNGRITYGDTACPAGISRSVKLPADLATEEARAAEQRARQERRELSRLEERQRLDEEREQAAQRSRMKAAAGKKKACNSLALQKKWREEDAAQASPKAAEKVRQQARRAAEKFDAECKPQ